MFLNNQKYWEVSYKYSDEFDSYLESIRNFIKSLITTNNDEFKIIDITKYSTLEGLDNSNYSEDSSFINYIETALSIIFENLFYELANKNDIIIETEFFKNKYCLFKHKKKIFYTKQSLNERRTIVQKVNGALKRKLASSLNNDILTFLQQHLNNQTMNIIKVFLDNKSTDITFIDEDKDERKVDFLPTKLSELSIFSELEYDNNQHTLTDNHLKSINDTFNLSIPSKDTIVSEAKFDDKIIGLVVDNYLFFYDIYELLKDKVLKTKEIKQHYLKENILIEDNKAEYKSDIINQFQASISSENLLNALSLLEENIYLTEDHFKHGRKQDTKDFFSPAYKVQTKYLKNYELFIPSIKKQKDKPIPSLFGLNNISNARDEDNNSQKGLKSWINIEDKEQNLVMKESVTHAEKVMHLLPEIAFYFKEKFFEDLLKEILIEIKNENPHLSLEIIDNKKFFVNQNTNIKTPLFLEADFSHNQEFDFILNYTKESGANSTIVLEAKTKLSKFIIQDQADKVEKYLEYDNLKIFDDYYLIGFNIASDVNTTMSYFIKNMSIDNCSNGLAFRYPLHSSNKDLYCLASNSKHILKSNILSILK
ncbi:hypothetical protein CRV08_07545 [Halarcobacter ebronensis]|uniref:Uncharacterized protein n=1 Tax=Halarcobacter ebronensis TaxID=1462615 RepID=A0A4Q0YDV3_9BACT|nr:hypothetical protein [Halarcobacter ebronensis]RXJ68666.1 hypothetical protein CRV08_07545 [Halarcobacter ebronensis]